MEAQANARVAGAQPAVKPVAEKTYFSDVRSFTALFQRIDEHGPIKGTAMEYPPDEVKEIIKDVLRGEKGIEYVTRSEGLRETVMRLLAGAEFVDVQGVTRQEALDVLRRAEIHGEQFNGRELTVEMLEKEGLAPAQKVRIDDTSIWFSSSPYQLDGGRVAVVAYVETADNKVVVRSYYRSNSAGLWRYLPTYLLDEHGGIKWYSKGYGEESITLPSASQKVLAELTQSMPAKAVANPELIFAGSSRNMDNPDKAKTYMGEVSEDPTELMQPLPRDMGGSLYAGGDKKIPPEELKPANTEDSADFSKRVMGWEQDTSVYGRISVEVFESHNGTYRYMFCTDRMGRSWIGGIEDDSEIKSVGLKTNWIWAGDLTTPAYEYESQTCGYGNERLRNGSYVDMFENYLSKVPMIREYVAWRNRTVVRQS